MSDAIRTERLLLRRVRPSDAEPLFALFANWEVIRWLSMPPWPYTLGDAHTFIDAQLNQTPPRADFYAITLDDALIGGIGARARNAAEAPARSPVLGYWLGQPHWGRGYMTEAARGFLDHVFASMTGGSVYSGVFADNAASLRVQEKLGFEHDGEELLYCRPLGEKRAHVNTRLARSRFLARSR